MQAAAHLDARFAFTTEFPSGNFGNAIRTACQIIANPSGVAVVRVTLSGFDTHANQAGTQARLLEEVARRSGRAARRAGRTRQVERRRSCSPTRNSDGGRRRTRTAAPTTARPMCISRWADAWPAACTARRRISRDCPATAIPRYALDFRGVMRRCSTSWWGVDSREVLGDASRPCRSCKPETRVHAPASHAAMNSFQCGALGRRDAFARERDFLRVLAGAQFAAHQAKALVHEVGVEHVALAIVAHVRELARAPPPRRPRCRPCRACPESRTAAPSRRAPHWRAAGTSPARPSGRDGACDSGRGNC